MKKENLTQKISVLSISLLLTSSQAINGVIPQMKASLGITQSQSELLGTLPSITVIIFILLSSFIAEKIGMKKTIIVGLLLAGIGGVLPVFVSSFNVVLLSRLILGAGLGIYNSLAVSYISSLYYGDTRASMLGIRSSMEAIGQTVLIFLAGILMNINWSMSFLVYLLAFPIAILFYLNVPEVDMESNLENKNKEKMDLKVYGLVLFAICLVMNSIAISVRFSSIVSEIKGDNFNSSNILALMPILGILAGFLFGTVNKKIGNKTLILGISMFILSNLLIASSNGNIGLLVLGLFLSSIPGAWCFPFIFSNLDRITKKGTINIATSLIFIGCNIGNFIAPLAMNFTQKLTNSNSLTSPFYIFAILFALVLIIVLTSINKIDKMSVN